MKDSGVEWIGEVPENWRLRRGKYLFSESHKKGGGDLTLLSPTQAYGVVPQSDLEGVVRVKEDTDFTAFKTVRPDDFIISLRSFQGGFEWSHISGVCTPAYTVFHASSDEVHPPFFARLFKCGPFIEKMDNITRGIREGKNIGYGDFANTFLPLPPMDEQKRIADYLNERCAAIDEVRQTITDEIEALRCLRKATIHRAVTKGLDEGVPMRDSGVKWIGEIPVRWAMPKLKHMTVKIGSGKTPRGGASQYVEEGVIFLRSQNIYNNGLVLDDVAHIDRATDSEMASTRVRKGDVLLNITGGSIGRCCLYNLSEHANVNQHVCIIRTDSTALPSFIHYYWLSYVGSETISLFHTAGNREGMSGEQIGQAIVPLPALSEQQQIVNYLDGRCAAIDSVIDTRIKQLERLEDYRRALIFAYVTGKKEVPSHE